MTSTQASTERPGSVLVTGASRGIGRAIALKLGQSGYPVAVHFVRDADGAKKTCDAIISAGGRAERLQFDIADRAASRGALDAWLENHDAFYGVVLNAGIARDGVFPMLGDEDWDAVIHTNLDGFYNVLSPLIMSMIRRRKPGRIVTLSSVSGVAGNRGQVNYSASKAGIIGASKALALELASRKITVNCVAPGLIETDMTADLPGEEMLKMIPAGRMGSPDDVAAVVDFLMSEGASYVTRQVIGVNGGMI